MSLREVFLEAISELAVSIPFLSPHISVYTALVGCARVSVNAAPLCAPSV
ncbi:MAG: hypothetical protein ABSE06_11950 [Anaerolineaceae bacterium]|jgi:hypothetical protein